MHHKKVENAANRLVRAHGHSVPVDVAAIASAQGLVVLKEPMPRQISAVLLLDADPPIIGVNSRHDPHRQRFSIAHELGHFLLHRRAAPMFVEDAHALYRDQRSAQGIDWKEIEANAFAAALLMPEAEVRSRLLSGLTDPLDEKTVARLAKEFKVSQAAFGIRLSVLNLV